ncbi:T6SS immunity protein Tli4 family protein [Burkholderia sp. L27(2015)]|uniref:T6SS immunity protein Tli4 family protein n=1 Tax=Burkholderia sp. L27(2015) TaxID=1641858 RepID=UPI00131BAA7B|nr:T6SS immunity protein Tli4 family protein [Burkholderia sp. L27(2015)]
MVTELTANLKPRCVGRYVIDIPGDAVTFGGAKIDGVDVKATAMTLKDYQAAMDARSKELNSTKSRFGRQFLYADTTVGGVPGSRFFISQGDPDVLSPANRVIEGYKWDRGYQIKLQIEGSDFTHPDQTNDPVVKLLPNKNDVPDKAREVAHLVDKVRGRTEDEIPTEPGVCFAGGFFPGRATDQENIWVQFVLRNQHDVSFNIDSNSDIRETTTLLQRGGEIDAGLKQNEGRTIRKGIVKIPGMQAEEWLMAGITQLRIPGNYMALEANSLIGSAQTPLVGLDMNTGSNSKLLPGSIEKASLTEGEAIALWDAVSRTLRPRPNGF